MSENMPPDFDLQNFLPYLLNQAAEVASQDFQAVYSARYGMRRTEMRVVFHLGQYGPMTARDISKRARMHKTKVSRAVSALEGKGYLSRATQERDRRHETLTLTRSGQGVYRDLGGVALAHDATLSAQLGPEQAAALKSALARIARLDKGEV